MTKEDLKKSEKGLDNKTRVETVVVKGTLTISQKEALQKLIGVLGSNEQDVVGKILTLWLYNEGFLKPKNSKTEKWGEEK